MDFVQETNSVRILINSSSGSESPVRRSDAPVKRYFTPAWNDTAPDEQAAK